MTYKYFGEGGQVMSGSSGVLIRLVNYEFDIDWKLKMPNRTNKWR